ncbi:carbonic anhydrase [Lentibacillus sp. CBA3610]|uniref:carbonic anhydrase n=1 Tax=Lentibacillus sp. CBA3610 TaxID=2518176 RepID=UPI00159605F6|nr:carbonic anhydrase [Lentibacillus sp. CBA3610]QKY71381.1 hypothetical protein Len3610_19135 [Lentibacillus sp. CBA3610]
MSDFATAINCMDGRVQLPVIEWMKEKFSVQYIDMITEAGPNKLLLEGTEQEIQSIKSRVQVSHEAHGSGVIAIVGHHGCAGNPVSKEEKWTQIKKSVETINTWGLSLKVLGLYVNENWEVETVTE